MHNKNLDVQSSQKILHPYLCGGNMIRQQMQSRLNDRLEDTQKLSTLAHELGHAVLLHQIGDEKSEHQKELEADALGIMLESYFGIEPTDSRRRHLAKHYQSL